jgi:hypothetical protein
MNSFALLPLLPQLSDALCKKYAFPDVFFPEGRKNLERKVAAAKAICDGCVEAKACLDFALVHDIQHGIWAGTTPEMRKNMQVEKIAIPTHPQTVADRIRELNKKGKSPRQIALLLKQDHAYVMLALSRRSRNKGEIQLQTTTENLLDDSSPLSESA